MSGLKNTKRRIVSAKNTQKVTRAMKLVSSAKFARAHHNITRAKYYAESLNKLLDKLQIYLIENREKIPLLEKRKEKKSLLIVMTADRGLCGALNSNVIKTTLGFLEEKTRAGIEVQLVLWGRKAQILSKKTDSEPISTSNKVMDKPNYDFCKKQLVDIFEGFKKGHWDRVYVVYSKFKNVISQQAQVLPLLPYELQGTHQANQSLSALSVANVVVEPPTVDFFESVIEAKITDLLFECLLNGAASDHAARMTAMDSATTNADKVISDLTLEYNRARQAAITKELIEITSGAEAL